MGSSTVTTTMAPPPAPRQRAIKPQVNLSRDTKGGAAGGQTSSTAAAQRKRASATASRGGAAASVASRGSSSRGTTRAAAARAPGKVFAAPPDYTCGPIYVPWETSEPPALCCGTRQLLAKVVAGSRGTRPTFGSNKASTSLPPTTTEPIFAVQQPSTLAARRFPPLLSPSPSSVGRGPSPTLHDSPFKPASTPQPDFLSSLTHLAYPSPASSTPTPPATSNLDEYIISAPAPASIEVDIPSEPTVNFEEDMLVWPTDLSTFSRPSSPKVGFEVLKTEEDLTVLSVVKREDESSLWTIEGTSSWTW
ncbi:hypothetical protein BCR35DRAFT_303408 [Leucosporidium creatinivorum]|uniref:Uncharacterized protein n=1 Tax=Leucosporidium creatinivorum TaxID=106004 RepID=A0A1Y2FJI6_9BASI|nr:hypothetical protein BCR35DRAFT_303408 [Leucosporidium creatinivorum]